MTWLTDKIEFPKTENGSEEGVIALGGHCLKNGWY